MIFGLAAPLALAIALPHLSRLERVEPGVAATMWAVSLALRAVASVLVVAYVVLLLPSSVVFNAVTHWCWHTVIPALETHLGLDGHQLGDAFTILPAALLVASASSIFIGLARAGRTVRRLVKRDALGPGPDGSLIVGGAEVLMAAAGLTHPKVVVSVGALLELDDGELAAGLAHERGHIARRHRWVLLAAEICRGVGRLVPGAGVAKQQLAFHLERDADAWALRRHDRATLARVIRKAAMSQVRPSPAYGLLSGGGTVSRRMSELQEAPTPASRVRRRLFRCVAAAGVVFVVGLSSMAPLTVAAAYAERQAEGPVHCS